MSNRQFVTIGTAANTNIVVRRDAASTTRRQGLVLDADHPLEVGETVATRIVLWSDSAPEETALATTEAGEIRIWNAWFDGDLIQSWIGAARITVDDEGDDLGLHCRDGHGEGGPDLSVRLSFDRAWTQPEDGDETDSLSES